MSNVEDKFLIFSFKSVQSLFEKMMIVRLGMIFLLSYSTCLCDSLFDETAYEAYKNLRMKFVESTNYWQVGNVFDTMTDYLLHVWDQHPDPELASIAFKKSKDLIPVSSCWYDDFGWWGIASVKSFDPKFDRIFGDFKSDFQKVSIDTWKIMNFGKSDGVHFGGPEVWKNRDNRKDFHPTKPPVPEYWATPRFAHGVGSGLQGLHQYDIFHNLRTPQNNWTGPPECMSFACYPSDKVTLGPYQLTVVNGLFFVLSARLRKWQKKVNTSQPLLDEYGYLKAWFGYDPKNPVSKKESLMLTFDENSGLIRERVSTYASHGGVYPIVQHWDAKTCWGGDQGLILGGLTDFLELSEHGSHHNNDVMSTNVVRNITVGVMTHMIDNEDGALQPWYPLINNKLQQWDAGDYKCGSGVFMRYLLHAYKHPKTPIMDIVQSKDFQDFLCSAAQGAAKIQQKDLFDSFNVLSILTTSQQLLMDPTKCKL